MIACATIFFVLLYTCFIFGGKILKVPLNTVEVHEKGEHSLVLRGGERGEKTFFYHNATLLEN